jgi:hypothetical protein
MKKFFVICWCAISLSATASAQTLVTRSVVSDQKGKDYAPNIVPTSDGQRAVFWARDKGSESVMIRGRGVQSDGTILTSSERAFAADAAWGGDRFYAVRTARQRLKNQLLFTKN